ncbi:MAG: leucine-rich repeat protein [Lachnospiraceae bacterium]|nr:leucine-rich repeat protein [Lachnospiraceae bacterium]
MYHKKLLSCMLAASLLLGTALPVNAEDTSVLLPADTAGELTEEALTSFELADTARADEALTAPPMSEEEMPAAGDDDSLFIIDEEAISYANDITDPLWIDGLVEEDMSILEEKDTDNPNQQTDKPLPGSDEFPEENLHDDPNESPDDTPDAGLNNDPNESMDEYSDSDEALLSLADSASDETKEPQIIASGNCGKNGDNLTWTLTDTGLLTISGEGQMANSTLDSTSAVRTIWEDYKDQITSVIVEEGVTSLGTDAFNSFMKMTSVSLPSSLRLIDTHAFSRCTGLVSIIIPEGVTHIGEEAFCRCISLQSIPLPASLTQIDDAAFMYCVDLESIHIPGSVKIISPRMFLHCKNLTSVTIGEGTTEIQEHSFENCMALTTVTLPGSITAIGSSAFSDCRKLSSINLPDGLTSLRNSAFYRCESLPAIDIPSGLSLLASSAFHSCLSLQTVTMPASITSIEDYAFVNCSALKDVYYVGSKEQWDAMTIYGENDHLINATRHYDCQRVVVAPTCSSPGYTGFTCSCGHYIKGQQTPALAHKSVSVGAVSATYTAAGQTAGIRCSVCNQTLTGLTVIPRKAQTQLSACTVTLSFTSKTFTGSALKPAVTVKHGGKTVPASNYSLTYANNKNVGTASVRITAKGGDIPYAGSVTKTFTITPKGTSITKVSAASKGFTVKWKKQTAQTSGYEIQYSTSRNFSSAKTVTITKNKTTSRKVTKLKRSKKYYVRIRTFKTVSGKKYYSAWSGKKSVKTKG